MKLYTLHISHRHGDDISIHPTMEAARAALADYSRQWWSREGLEGEPPADDTVLDAYWDHVQDESSDIAEHDFAPATDAKCDDDYLSRFPADQRATADRAYQDGYVDGVESDAPDVLYVMRSRLAEAVDAWPQYDVDDTLLAPGCIPDDEISSEVNGGDLVEWFGEWRGRVKELLATTA